MFLCYTETVKNLTVSLPDEIYRKARVHAARRDTSVSAMVRDYLVQLSNGATPVPPSRSEGLRAALDAIRQSQIESGVYFNAADRLSRDELYEDALRRHEHSVVRD